ncbi:nuclear transport factor 2 family protein [Luteolibacter flavescens]|uniref:Nuclear transport factor 2 family protein n=1 Tax=Luteolibacter flavescens TaxID=1859460 RepID=A0ABT3FKE5_9BACT|nr:ketosteroid isomerase-related protein [Luteolibacter flavescens]MCW1884043.1 nuclear transport factor 2 family protein [Luteolibacter flavescens]
MKSLIETYYAAFNSGDREALLELLADDVVHEVNEGEAETGKDAFRAFLGRMDRSYRETVEELEIFTGPENRAAAEFYIRGEYLATDAGLPEAKGQTYHLRVGAFFEARLGKITRVTNYYNLRDWLAQVS